jgi:hypothetical protein
VHSDAEQAAGIDFETDAYLGLNEATHEAIVQVPRGQRWRAFGGADELLRSSRGAE